MSKFDKFLKETVARVNHQCDYCGNPIRVGDVYYSEKLKDLFLHSLHEKRFCSKCYKEHGDNLLKVKKGKRKPTGTPPLERWIGDKSTWIGPTKCDEQREARERDWENIWKNLVSAKGYRETYLFLMPAIDLFREALSCYQNGAYMAAVSMCRASTETLVYLLASRQIEYRKGQSFVREVKVDHSLTESKFGEMLAKAKAKGYVNIELEKQINKIRKNGNFALHYGQRYDKELEESTRHGVPEGWIGMEKTRDVLRDTSELLTKMIGKTFIIAQDILTNSTR